MLKIEQETPFMNGERWLAGVFEATNSQLDGKPRRELPTS